MASRMTAEHKCLAKHKLATPLRVRTQNRSYTKRSSCGTATGSIDMAISRDIWLMELRQRKVVVHSFGVVSQVKTIAIAM